MANDDKIDEYSVFLESWEPRERLEYACLAHNQSDPVVQHRLLIDSGAGDPLERATYEPGYKVMSRSELDARHYAFFEDHQDEWSGHLRDYLEERGIPTFKIDIYVSSFANLWVDGRRRRQDSPQMMAIKASIRDHDREFHPKTAGQYVINSIDPSIDPLFTLDEMATVFEANRGLIDAFMPNYVDALRNASISSPSDLSVRRGVYMPGMVTELIELHYLSSYSLGLELAEQFAQIYTPATRDSGVASLFSAPLPAVQSRIVAFAPFIASMDLRQLELVVAPPTVFTPLTYHDVFGGIQEYSFQ